MPTFRRLESRDGKVRLYLLAPNPNVIEYMLRASGLKVEGVRYWDEQACYIG